MNAPAIPAQETLGDTLLRILIEIANRQSNPADREAMLDILRKDGWL